MNWDHDHTNVNRFVDKLVSTMEEANTHPAASKVIDMVFRPYLQWLHSAQIQEVDPTLARNISIHVLSVMTLELAARVNTQGEDGEKLPVSDWVSEFMNDLYNEINADLQEMAARKGNAQ